MQTVLHLVLLLGLVASVAPATADDIPVERDTTAAFDVEADVEHAPPAHDPAAAWSALQATLPAGTTVRRIAFATHGANLLHSPPGETRVFTTFIDWMDPDYHFNPVEPFTGQACVAPGVPAADVTSALTRLLASKAWRKHRDTLDSLILECHDPVVFWWLLLVPEGGFQADVPIETVKIAFEP